MAEFRTFEAEGKVYHAVGLLRWWRDGYGPWDNWMYEPPLVVPSLQRWMDKHNVRLVDFIVGPPHLEFPDMKTAMKFKRRWHDITWLRMLPRNIYEYFGDGYRLAKNNAKVMYGIDLDFYDYVLADISKRARENIYRRKEA